MLEESRQAGPYFPGSYGPGALSPGSSDVSTAGASWPGPQPPFPPNPQPRCPALPGRDRAGGGGPETPGAHPGPASLGTATSQSPHSSDSGGSDVDLDPTDSKLFSRGECRECPMGRVCPLMPDACRAAPLLAAAPAPQASPPDPA